MRFKTSVTFCFLWWTMLCSACKSTEPVPTVGFYKFDDQRLTGETAVVSDDAGFTGMTLLVTIDTSGRVSAVEPVDNFQKLDPAPAVALVRKWTFRPQTFDGKPVNAVGLVSIAYNKREIPGDPAVPFPIGSLTETAITLERGACYGSCPDYRVTIHGDGLVEFDTGDDHFAGTAAKVHLEYNGHNVLLPGHHTARVEPGTVAHLLSRFRAAHFFGLKNQYAYGATDASTQVLTLTVGRTTKKVTDYIGTMAGMPQAVRDLEEAVDAAAGTARWVSGDQRTFAELDEHHFDYRSLEAVTLGIAAARKMGSYNPSNETAAFVSGLIERGVPLGAKFGDETLGSVLIVSAAAQGDEKLFDQLAARGALASASPKLLTQSLASVGCSTRIAQALVKAGADPKTRSENGTALTALRGGGSVCEGRPEEALGLARTLIELGVPLEAQDGLGWTALMGCDSPELARLLLDNGADPRARAKDRTTTVLSTDDDRVALILLRAGADPNARNDRGSVREQATRNHMPATLAWLDAHGVR